MSSFEKFQFRRGCERVEYLRLWASFCHHRCSSNLWIEQGGGADPRGTRAGVISRLLYPQEQRPEDLFPWISYAALIGAGPTATDSLSALATAATAIQPNSASAYVTADSTQTQWTGDKLDSMILSLFRGIPSTSSATLRQTAGLSPVPASNTTEDHTDLFNVLFPPTTRPSRR